MKKLELNQMEIIQGEGWLSDACYAFGAASVVFEAGVMANLWNPLGQSAAVGMLVINAGCLFA